MEVIIFVIAGCIAGLLSGIFGLGGGVIVVPMLVLAFDLMHKFSSNVMHVAEGTSLAIMVITTASSSLSHYRRGNVLFVLVLRLVPGILIGVVLGALLAHVLSSFILRLLFATFLGLVACRMFYTSYLKSTRHAHQVVQMPGVLSSSIVSLFIGFCSGLLGTGAGTTTVPYLNCYGYPMKNIAATSASCSLPIAIIGAITYLCLGLGHTQAAFVTGYIDWSALLFVAIGSLLCAPIGARIASQVDSLLLKRIFTLLLILLSADMFFSAFSVGI